MDIVTLALAKKYADSINSGITNITTENNKLIFTLQNGNTIEVPLTDLVNNVVTEEELLNKLKDYIKNTDFASAEKAGIIKVDATSYATELDNGKLKASTKTYENYKDMNNESFIGKGTLENVIAGKNLETTNNKVTFVDKDSTDTEYPSAKVMYKVSNKLDTLKDEVLDTGEASDSFIHIEDSAISELQELEVEGVCEQKTTTGKNLLECLIDTQTKNGVTITNNGDGTYTLNGTATANAYFYPAPDKWKNFGEAGTYYFSSNVYENIAYALYKDDGKVVFWKTSAGTFELTETINIARFQIGINDGATFNNKIIKLMIEKGSTETSWEPYTGGIASPNPEYPQEIKTITNSLNVTSCNKNIFINELLTTETTMNGVTITPISDTIFKLNGTATSTTYFNLRREKVFGAFILRNVENSIKSQTVNGYTLSASISNGVTNVGHNANNGLWSINIASGAVYNNAILKIQLEQGLIATSYEEHIQSQINANLPEEEFIGKINDTYKDTLKVEYNEEDGQYHLNLHKCIGKVVLDGSDDENWHISSLSVIGYKSYYIDSSIRINQDVTGKCNYFEYKTFNEWQNLLKATFIENSYQSIGIRITETLAPTLEDFKTWLSTHNTEVYYALAKPYVVDLGIVDMPITYNEITNLFINSDLLPKINATYYRNFKQTIKNINSDISSIKSNYVKNTDYATNTTAGVVKANVGLFVDKKGYVGVNEYGYDEYKSKTNNFFIGKGTLENVITGKNLETANNKVTSLGTGSTDIEYPSAKCTYKIKEDLDNLKSDILEKGEVSDSCVHVEDSIKNKLLKLKVDGVCEQETTVGRNRLKPTIINTTVLNGITYIPTYNSNGILEYIRITGTASPINSELPIGNFDVKNGTSYVISGNPDMSAAIGLFYQLYEKDTKNWKINIQSNNRIYTATEDASYDLVIHVGKGATIDAIFYPQVVEGTQIYPYEPYTGGQPSPNPDYPQEIKTIENSLKITSCNKNLFDGELELGIYNNSTGEKESSIVSIRSVNYISVKPNTSYTVLEENNKSIYFHEYDKNKIFISTNALLNTPKTITTSANTNYLTINTRGSENVTDINTKIIIVEGTTVTSFEQHIQSQITANLPEGEFIGKLNNTYKDALNVKYNEKDGQYHLNLYKNIGKVVLDGSKGSISMPSQYKFNIDNVITNYLKINTYNNYSLSDRYIVVNQTSTNSEFDKASSNYNYAVNFGSDTANNVRIKDVRFNSINDFKNELNANPIIFYYILATDSRYTVDLGVVDMPLSYDEVTNIFTDSDLLPQINAKYYKNFITTIKNLQVNNEALKDELVSIKNRLTTLENANTSVVSESEVADDIQEQ